MSEGSEGSSGVRNRKVPLRGRTFSASALFNGAVQETKNACRDAYSGGEHHPQPLGHIQASHRSDSDTDSSAQSYHSQARKVQLKQQSNAKATKGRQGLKKTGVGLGVLAAFAALHWANQNPLTSKGAWLDSVGYNGTWPGAYGYRFLQWWANPDFDGYVFQQLAGNLSSWEPPSGCHVPKVGTHIKKDALQTISACYYDAFDKLQLELNTTLCDAFPPKVQRKQYIYFRWAGGVVFFVVFLWTSFKLKMLPAQEWWSEPFFNWVGFKPKFNWVTCVVFILAVFITFGLMVPGLAMFFSIRGTCSLLKKEQHDFLRRLQTAAVLSLYEREFKCILFYQGRSPIQRELVEGLSNRIVQSLLLVPIGKFIWTAWNKASSVWHGARALANGESDCVNFSLNIMQSTQDGRQLIWRTLCEVRKDDLITNLALRELTTKAAASTTSEYPFLHTHEQGADLNLLVLNRISQLVGAYRYFGMDETDDLQVKLRDYCFGVTCENYDDHDEERVKGDRKLRHEKKIRVMIVRKDLLEQIFLEGADEEKIPTFGPQVDPEKGKERWRTLQAMAKCFAEKTTPNCVWEVQVPYNVMTLGSPRSGMRKGTGTWADMASPLPSTPGTPLF